MYLKLLIAYMGDSLDVMRFSNSGGSSRRRKCCWLSSGKMENSMPDPSCVDIVSIARLHAIYRLEECCFGLGDHVLWGTFRELDRR